MSGYAVVDVETTGRSAAKSDRIVEFACVHVSPDGEIENTWATLVNPQRDVGPTSVHGITATDVMDAPNFSDIAPHVVSSLKGRVMVAHNARFDAGFIAAELGKCHESFRGESIPTLCTMTWSPSFLQSPSRRLADCCEAAGIDLNEAHSAEYDALATAQLLQLFLRQCRDDVPWSDQIEASGTFVWPPVSISSPLPAVTRSQVAKRAGKRWVDGIIACLPRAADHNVDAYLALLSESMADNVLTGEEKGQLLAAAQTLGIPRGQAIDLHAAYLRQMVERALEDGALTTEETKELKQCARQLGLGDNDVVAQLELSAAERSSNNVDFDLTLSGVSLQPGNRVVFTGDLPTSKSELEQLAGRHGLEVGGVTKKTAVVVAADVNSLSSKARKARSYGIPIITEPEFHALLRRMK